MEVDAQQELVGSEIHGFRTLQDLDFQSIMEEARTRWLRPNEIHAILFNYNRFKISVKPVNLPPSGTIVLFDRKMLRNFRKDGHNWKKKKDGKTVKEAHEHLKVGDEERIHVYYAHGQDNLTFVRRCYWLLEKSLEHIVLVHYRETQELQGSPVTPVNSSSSTTSDPSALRLDSKAHQANYTDPGNHMTARNLEQSLHEINTLEWDELLEENSPVSTILSEKGDQISCFDQPNQIASGGSLNNNSYIRPTEREGDYNTSRSQPLNTGSSDSLEPSDSDKLQSQDSFGQWIDQILTDTPGSIAAPAPKPSMPYASDAFSALVTGHQQSSEPEHIFCITDISPSWAFSTETTKILVTGLFHEQFLHLAKSSIFSVCGDVSTPAEVVQVGVYRFILPPHSPGLVNLFLSVDGHKPISQVLNFEYRPPVSNEAVFSSDEKIKWEELQLQMRLAYLLFSTSKNLNIFSNKVSPAALKEARKFNVNTSHLSNSLAYLIKSVEENKTTFPQAKEGLFELILRNRLKEWLLEKIVEGSKKITVYDDLGRGVIHLCAILGYNWAISLFAWSGLSLDFRDKHGWTALHWAAYCGREKMVTVLLSYGAKPNLVTDPTPENPGGRTAADLAYLKGYEGLAAFLSEKALVAQFKDMSIAGNISGSLETSATDTGDSENLSEEQLFMKDTLAAYRTAAEAAGRIQAAIREHALKQKTKAVQVSTPEDEARVIVAALKIQHAFRNYETRKKIVAAARIQHRFRTWKLRREFLNMRRHAVRIQAAFRGFQARKQYRKIVWSVGVLEKVILRWRLKRKGFRGLRVPPVEVEPEKESDTEEEFYRASQKQAQERIERSVVTVQAMFRSKKAQEEYHRMKLTHKETRLEYEGLLCQDEDMEIGGPVADDSGYK